MAFDDQWDYTHFDRKFSKNFIGDFTFDIQRLRKRRKVFLQRNLRCFLQYHQTLLETTPESQLFEAQAAETLHPTLHKELNPELCLRDLVNGHHRSGSGLGESLEAKPAQEAVSRKCLCVRAMTPDFEAPARRSLRKVQEQVYHHDDAELTINIVNVRKKLDFTINKERPHKRLKRDFIRCQCSLTIWDTGSKGGEADPIVKKNVFGRLSVTRTEAYGPSVDVELDKPFVIKAADLKVPLEHNNELFLGLGESYFMELKLIPTRADTDWPPIPILGRSDGDQNLGLTKLAQEKLAGALVARYTRLPQAPEPDIPLSVFYLHEGTTYRTKSGLEVVSHWDKPSLEPEIESADCSWAIDDDSKYLGKKAVAIEQRSKARTSPGTQLQNGCIPKLPTKITYQIDPNAASALEIGKEFRKFSTESFQCPVCPTFEGHDLLELRFHFISSHHKYNFVVKEPATNERGRVKEIAIRVEPVEGAKPSKQKDTDDVFFIRPTKPFGVGAYVDGDRSWTGGKSRAKGPKRPEQSRTNSARERVVVYPEETSKLREMNGGFLPSKDVKSFRKAARKKYKQLRLQRLTDTKNTTYTSITHRPKASSEEPMSETDDEIEDDWFVQRHLEHLDITAREEEWPEMKRELNRRWDEHRLEEKLEHPRYVSDSLVRFVRNHKDWLSRPSSELALAFKQLIGDLTRTRLISAALAADVFNMIAQNVLNGVPHQQPPNNGIVDGISDGQAVNKTSSATPAVTIPQGNPAAALQAWKQHVSAQSPDHCGMCTAPVSTTAKDSMQCSAPDCETPTAAFHITCVKLKKKHRNWVCQGCRLRSKLMGHVMTAKGKGKMKALDRADTFARLTLLNDRFDMHI